MPLIATVGEWFLLLIPIIVVAVFAVVGIRRNRRDIKSQRREIAQLNDLTLGMQRELQSQARDRKSVV